MKVKILLFGPVRERVGKAEVVVDVPMGTTVGALADKLGSQYPDLSPALPRCRFAVNGEYAGQKVALKEGDEVALIPPVSGG